MLDGTKGSRGGRNKTTSGAEYNSTETGSVKIARGKSSTVTNRTTISVQSGNDTSKQDQTPETRGKHKRGSRRSEGCPSNTEVEGNDNGRQRDSRIKDLSTKGRRGGGKRNESRNDQVSSTSHHLIYCIT